MCFGAKGAAEITFLAVALLLSLVCLWLSIRNLLSTRHTLKFGPTGIWTSKLGFLAWKHVRVRIESVYGGKAGILELLTIRPRHSEEPLEVIALTSLSGSTASIERLIKQYKQEIITAAPEESGAAVVA